MFKLKDYKEEPYVLDVMVSCTGEETIKIPALTEKNRNFIEAVVKLDSRYGKENNENGEPNKKAKEKLKKLAESSNYPFGKDLKFSLDEEDNKYIGTTHYWFKQIKENKENNFINILGALYNINLTNSTRRSYKEVFYKAKHLKDKLNNKLDYETIKTELLKDFKSNKTNHIITYLTDPKVMEGNGSCTLSLASKFCSYACNYFNLEDLYSKYDTIVSNNLHYYIDAYLDNSCDLNRDYTNCKKSNFKVNGDKNRFEKNLMVYEAYSFFIEKIIEKIGIKEIGKNELDHIIWYSKK
ncbi:hypothetical protein [Succinivibrio dextrinosolvens]|uniref:hypothetical protein n=1 Tax=Succinivibrio dextrinosolvens TaxID=83771 RepID=UPI00241F8004|nr:hypothetical protein [Succinivibrio dextrinosolvens]MBE6422869.1 hypothetical protein [Succinivibrio dextrinosolvens]